MLPLMSTEHLYVVQSLAVYKSIIFLNLTEDVLLSSKLQQENFGIEDE